MTLKQIELLREIVRQSMNISAAALALGTSQPGVSRQIQDLERELGTPLLVRKRNRIVALTEAGRMVLTAAERLLGEVENIRLIGAEVRRTGGRLVVATTHLHARYTLLGPFQRLRTMHSEVELLLLQSVADDIDKLVAAGDADIGVGTGENGDIAAPSPRIARLAGEVLRRSAIIPIGHPLARRPRLSLEELGTYPLVGYGACSPTGLHIGRAFAAVGITPNYIVRASDSDVIKAYVAQGIGVGIVPTACITQSRPPNLVVADVTALLPEARTVITMRRDMYLRRHVVDFVRMIAPAWTRSAIQRAQEEGV